MDSNKAIEKGSEDASSPSSTLRRSFQELPETKPLWQPKEMAEAAMEAEGGEDEFYLRY